MKNPFQLTKAVTPVIHLFRHAPGRRSLVIPLVLACFALSPTARAACEEGCDANLNTFLGEDALFSLTTGTGNTAIGWQALHDNTTGGGNTASGFTALHDNTTGASNTAAGAGALYSNDTGSSNTATGENALLLNTTGNENTANGEGAMQNSITGSNNTANGFEALFGGSRDPSTGSFNTANGAQALYSNTSGGSNTASGYQALYYNATGVNNTANGTEALLGNSTGSNNTATGFEALFGRGRDLSTGSFNTANGVQALYSISTGGSNTASGYYALYSNTTGNFNAANGANALEYNTTGGGNVANGGFALFVNTTGMNNVAEGFDALFDNTTGSGNIGIGLGAGGNLTTGSNNIDIGNAGIAGESKTIRIGTGGTHTKTLIAGISGVTVPGGVGVIVGTNGKLGTVVSSARFKDQIKPMDKASEAILALQPVTFRYKHELDPDGTPQFGLVAEEVAKVNPDLVARDEEGKPYTVRYEAVNAMLLNEFLKAHRKIDEQDRVNHEQKTINTMLESTVTRQQKEIQALTASLKQQAAQIQKVNEQIALSRPAARLVAHDR